MFKTTDQKTAPEYKIPLRKRSKRYSSRWLAYGKQRSSGKIVDHKGELRTISAIKQMYGEEGYPKNYFLVTFPSLPGCVTQDDTFEEARKNAHEALDAWLIARCTLEHKYGPVPRPDGTVAKQSGVVSDTVSLDKIRPSTDVIRKVTHNQQSFCRWLWLTKITPLVR